MRKLSTVFAVILFSTIYIGTSVAKTDRKAISVAEDSVLLMGNTMKLTVSVPMASDSVKVDFPLLSKAAREKKSYVSLLNDTVELQVNHNRALDYQDGKYWMRYNLTIQAFDSGKYTIPSLEFIAGNDTVYSNPVGINVIPVKAKADDPIEPFSDILEPFEVNPDDPDLMGETDSMAWVWWIVAVIVLLAVLLIYLYVKFMKTGRFILGRKQLSPDAYALKSLRKLREQQLPRKGKTKEYYTGLTDILRKYLNSQFGIKTYEKTSSEILGEVRESEQVSDFADNLKSIFETADYVKFAKVNPDEAENERCMKEAVSFIESSRPVTVADEEKGGKK